ncbi:MAG: glycoside hydrolase family 127 protein [Bacteroidales bacterium]|nr:glycoside hydrolase family 127 protein [Bacteroidales bacterium]
MKVRTGLFYLFFLLFVITFEACNFGGEENADYPIKPVSFTQVRLHDQFWLPRILKNTEVTIPIAFQQSEETGRIKNFEIAGGLIPGSFCSKYAFDDSDVFKIIEGASYSLMIKPDPVLETYLDSLIYKIAMAQEDDGYLYTNRTIMGDSSLPMAGKNRWDNIEEGSHELYNVGHLYEAAVAYYQATGKKNLLEVALKNADLIYNTFGWGKLEIYPGHQEIEIGLVKLYRITGDKKYLDLAKFFLDVRGPDGLEYNQAHQKVVDQKEPVGHAVRALYMYSAMADVAALTGDQAYKTAIDAIWENVVSKKIYITGGVGQSGGNEGFGPGYDLPNLSAYCETCASIANVLWNQRMFLQSGDSKYIDVMERTLYNALLSGVSLSGDRFFYPNPLESNGETRKEWFGCACCPSNICRFLPSVPGYIYALDENKIYINLFVESEATFETENGRMTITQSGDYPWSGEMTLHIYPEYAGQSDICIRIPGWAGNEAMPGDLYEFVDIRDEQATIKINNEEVNYNMVKGYAVLNRNWQAHDSIQIGFPFEPRKIKSDKKVRQNRGRFAIQRGPIVFCIEESDNPDVSTRNILVDISQEIHSKFEHQLMNGILTVSLKGQMVRKTLKDSVNVNSVYNKIKGIPYAYWANRKPGQMLVWIPYDLNFATPAPAPTIAYKSKKSSSGARGNLNLLSDQYEPFNSNDHSIGYIHWWPEKNKTEWLIYEFDKPESIYQVKVFWFDDSPNGGCRIPADWKIYYKQDSLWTPVANNSEYTITKDAPDKLNFIPVVTNALKLEVRLQENFSSGVHEWSVK